MIIPTDRNQIDELIWQGREPESPTNSVPVGDVGLLVLCYGEGVPRWSRFHNRGFLVHEAPFDDDQRTLQAKDVPTATMAAQAVVEAVRKGTKVLVTCHQGLNRSGLVVGIALHELHGWSGADCVARVRERRPGALFNLGFASYIESLK